MLIALFFNAIEEGNEEPNCQQGDDIPDYEPGDECAKCQDISAHINAHVQAIPHEPRPNAWKHGHSRIANHIHNADPSGSDF